MSLVDLESLSKKEIILHYILECKGLGSMLPYSDLHLIEYWLTEIGDDAEALLLILSEILPQSFAAAKHRWNLKGIHRQVVKKIHEYKNSEGL